MADIFDLRGMEPPEPLLFILRHIDVARNSDALTVHLWHDPVPLYPELAERGWTWEKLREAPDGVILRVSPAGGEGRT
ncbi:MAG: DUF2249 domain-containing protein [Alphaproteobacteria bacterium]|nr:DUF2249 domain-containing protein [Alphaproteobacteria bacterium]